MLREEVRELRHLQCWALNASDDQLLLWMQAQHREVPPLDPVSISSQLNHNSIHVSEIFMLRTTCTSSFLLQEHMHLEAFALLANLLPGVLSPPEPAPTGGTTREGAPGSQPPATEEVEEGGGANQAPLLTPHVSEPFTCFLTSCRSKLLSVVKPDTLSGVLTLFNDHNLSYSQTGPEDALRWRVCISLST